MTAPGPDSTSREEEIAGAIAQLLAARNALSALTAGQVDAIIDPSGGATVLLQKAQEALLESRAHYRRLLKQMPTLVFELAEDGTIVFLNDAIQRVTGYRADELEGQNWWRTFVPGEPPAAQELRRRLATSDVASYELPIRARNGATVVLELTTSNQFRLDGTVEAIVGFASDVTVRVRAAEERLRTLLDGVTEYAIYMLDSTGHIASWNSGAQRITGYSAQDVLGKHVSMFVPDEQRRSGTADRLLLQASTSGRAEDEGWRIRKDGSRYLASAVLTALRDPGGALQGFAKITRDVTELRRAELLKIRLAEERARRTEIEASLQRLRLFVEHAPAAIAMFDREMRYLLFSRRWVRDYRLKDRDISGRSHYEVFPDLPQRWRDAYRRCLEGAHESCEEDRFERAGGGLDWVRWSAHPWSDGSGAIGGIIIFSEIITEQRLAKEALAQSEERLRQAQKMEAVGQLAGGVAHDFNNMLTAITGYSELILGRLPRDHEITRQIQQIRRAADRATSLTRQLLAFSRKQGLQPRVFDLNEVVTEAHGMLRRLIGEDIEIAYNTYPDLGLVRADPCQVEQVVINLAVNARDAMPTGGTLTIETSNVELDATCAQSHPDVAPGRYVLVAVTDTGTGMDAATLSRIFEPFYTTKDKGKGTGLGLSTVHGIVKQSGGHISVSSELGRGSTFKVYLPRVQALPERVPCTSSQRALARRGAETILVVEDDEFVREIISEVLNNCGYEVMIATRGMEAIQLVEQHRGPIHLLLTDVVLPQMSGPQIAERVTAIRPEIRVLFMSGYPEEAIVHRRVLDPGTAFVHKPFTSGALAREVRAMLDGATVDDDA